MRIRIIAVLTTLWLLLGNPVPNGWNSISQDMVMPAQSTLYNILGLKEILDMEVPVGARLIVFSPHPDDEALAASGIIQRVLENEGKVLVVYMTNGDGYVEGVRLSLGRTNLTPADFISYGIKRQGEAVNALSELGLHSEGSLFLGFPDQGIDNLWEYYWSRLTQFTSPYTRCNHAHYKSGVNHWVRYNGTDLDKQIRKTIRNFAPTMVVLPDPRDNHPDHSATGIFALDALRRLALKGKVSIDGMEIFTYLVHYPGYPSAKIPMSIVPTAGSKGTAFARPLADMQWVSLDLNDEELGRKKRALEAYRSQWQVLGYFMKDFMRPSELFGRLDAKQVLEVPEEAPSHRM